MCNISIQGWCQPGPQYAGTSLCLPIISIVTECHVSTLLSGPCRSPQNWVQLTWQQKAALIRVCEFDCFPLTTKFLDVESVNRIPPSAKLLIGTAGTFEITLQSVVNDINLIAASQYHTVQ